ncbi:MAG: 50S ribosomal protein L30 [Candidatus Tectomicrobia bacterium]|uniref:50S ribosomal protein L30 n=1 Tax=Tectimicrobiota bacterium TaxID=2528274 RepID=A0A932I0X1_UNCTE|nr:50S ribosomal protein L30 [Candidatus Tectomicrobia bacterium]
MADQIKITLKKSVSGSKPVHREALRGLGLRRINQSVYRKDNPSIRGLIFQVKHLVDVEEGA